MILLDRSQLCSIGSPSFASIIPGFTIKRVPVLLMMISVPLVIFSTSFKRLTSWGLRPGSPWSPLISLTMTYLPDNKDSIMIYLRLSWPKNSIAVYVFLRDIFKLIF